MKRLTERNKIGKAYYPKCFERCNGDDEHCHCCELDDRICERLAQYEDSGLTPAEVAELAQAKADGRCVVLPCKVGDTVYAIDADGEIWEMSVGFIGMHCDSKNKCFQIARGFDWFGKTVFLTREKPKKHWRSVKVMKLICNSCGRDLNEIYQDNMSEVIGCVLCEDCAGYPLEVNESAFGRDCPAPVVEVGKNPDGTIRCICPDCGHMFHDKSHITNFCPNCGRKLDGGGEGC